MKKSGLSFAERSRVVSLDWEKIKGVKPNKVRAGAFIFCFDLQFKYCRLKSLLKQDTICSVKNIQKSLEINLA